MKLEPLLQQALDDARTRSEAALDRLLPAASVNPPRLHEAMRYSALAAGKRVRPLLTYATGQALGGDPAKLDIPAAAIECIHAYSLIHDDLPAMDDDDLRRGLPTCHKAYDEATAILAGDALQTLAFRLLAHEPMGDVSAETRIAMIDLLAQASGSRGMVGGQAIDLAAVGTDLDLAALENMHIHKTGALIRASVLLGAMVSPGGDHPDVHHALDRYAKKIGLAFQIHDDVLDVSGNTERLGKTSGADMALDKPTYTSLLGLAGARDKAQELIDDAIEALADLGQDAETLRQIARYIIGRTR